jgi:hypothetical protein
MTFTTIIAINAVLDLAIVLALAAVVYLTHRHLHEAARPDTVHPSEPFLARVALPAHEAEELAEAA